jgi:hypothetical protein
MATFLTLVRTYRTQLLERLQRVAAPATAASGRGGGWLKTLTDGGDALLFAVPAAGAGPSVFRPWRDVAPPGLTIVVVHMPGREERLDETPYSEVGVLADRIAEHVRLRADGRPFGLFGHSAGPWSPGRWPSEWKPTRCACWRSPRRRRPT